MAERNGSERALVIRGGALGDLALTIPLIRAAREKSPDVQFELLGYPETAQFLVDAGLIARTHRVDAARFGELLSGAMKPDSETAEWLARFSSVISVWRDPERKMFRAIHNAGVRDVAHIEPIPPEGASIHAADFMLEQFFGTDAGHHAKPDESLWAPITMPEDLLAWAHRYVRENLHIGAHKIVVVHPGSGGRGKNRNWPPEMFGKLIDKLLELEDVGALILRGPADEKTARAATHATSTNAPVASGLNSSQLTALLSYVDGCVGNDSGVSHLAAITGIRTVAIFGSTNRHIWAPKGKDVAVLPGDDAKEYSGNIREISVDDVFYALEPGL